MLEKNSILLGLVIGILIPVIGYALFFGLYEGLEAAGLVSTKGFRPLFRERTCAILAIALSAIALNFYQKRYLRDTVRGLVITITLWVIAWIVVFGKHVF